MPTAGELSTIAQHIKTAQDQGLSLKQPTAEQPGFDAAAAYVVADLIHAMRLAEGARAVGRKIGLTNPALWGHVHDTTVAYAADSPNDRATRNTQFARLVQPKIEPEIIFTSIQRRHHTATRRHGGGAGLH